MKRCDTFWDSLITKCKYNDSQCRYWNIEWKFSDAFMSGNRNQFYSHNPLRHSRDNEYKSFKSLKYCEYTFWNCYCTRKYSREPWINPCYHYMSNKCTFWNCFHSYDLSQYAFGFSKCSFWSKFWYCIKPEYNEFQPCYCYGKYSITHE